MKQNARRPAANKASVDFLLSGKAFCGHCGEPMCGDSGSSRHGYKCYYYSCSGHKHHHSCDKKSERKDDLEAYVVQQTLLYVLQEDRLQQIADVILAEYEKEFNTAGIRDCERRLAAIDRELNNLTDALADAPRVARDRIYDKMNHLDAERSAVETDLSKLRIAASVRLSRDEIVAWLRSFCSGSPSDPAFCHTIIDTFVNSVYIYDDRILIFYNLRNTHTTVSHADLPDTGGSDLIAPTPLPQTLMA